MTRWVLALCLVTAADLACAARAVIDEYRADDSDGMSEHRLLLGIDRTLSLLSGEGGVRAGRWHITDAAGTEDFNVLKLKYDSGSARDWRARLDATQLFGEGSPTLGSASINWSGGPWSIEASGQRDIVDTVTAIRSHDASNIWALFADYRFNARWTLVGGGYTASFSDGNHRVGQVARLVYSPEKMEGFTLQGRVRRFEDTRRDVGYFSPGQYQEYLMIAGYRRSILSEKWVVGGQLGGGRQDIDSDRGKPLYVGELSLRGWFTDHLGLDGRVSYSNAGGSAVSQGKSGYRYSTVNLSVIGSW
jgi:hypothetical protein